MDRRPSSLVLMIILIYLVTAPMHPIAVIALLQKMTSVLLVLFLPGYTITEILFPPYVIGIPERSLLSVGISIAVTIIIGLVLNLTPWGLHQKTWGIALISITLITYVIAFIKQRRYGHEGSIRVASTYKRFRLQTIDVMLLGLSLVVVGVALLLNQLPIAPSGLGGYTQLWMIPTNDNNITEYRLGVTSGEFFDTYYYLEVRADDKVLREWDTISLKAGEAWETTFTVPPEYANSKTLVANLYKLDNPQTPYRTVHVWRQGQ